MGNQHLAVRVHINACSFRLFQQHLHIPQIVSGHENTRFVSDAAGNLRDLCCSVVFVCCIQQSQHLCTNFAALQNQCLPLCNGVLFEPVRQDPCR